MTTKTGRRASPEERDRARDMIRLYREAARSPDGRCCINPEAAPDERVFIAADDPEPLLLLLEEFAEHGTFAPVTGTADRLLLNLELKELRAHGMNKEAALSVLGERHHADPRTIERRLKR
ncbi:hypothetical protein [Ramlibacter sp.]|uniref:hypothetical protein n=1 Tax=Ramlibacter sp. TaxID=1917967 RepID=UPI002BC4FE34|nr:hypothetical protein [Ramlibacter sp.]HWI81388.1 hypothetical protein [Ramlibacter sp.]